MNTKGAYCNNSEFNYNLRRNDTITYENNMEISNAYPIRSNELRGGWGVFCTSQEIPPIIRVQVVIVCI